MNNAHDEQKDFDRALLVFARHLVDEMRYINYPKEWSSEPLARLLPLFFVLLDHHPRKLGSIVQAAYARTFPKLKRGNINQLDTLYPEFFAKTRQYYADEYLSEQLLKNKGDVHTEEASVASQELKELAANVIQVFATLAPKQENEHRTLEQVCFALQPVYIASQLSNIGWDLAEYADYWRTMPAADREAFAQEITKRWLVSPGS